MPIRRGPVSVPSILAKGYVIAVAIFCLIVASISLQEHFESPYLDDWRMLDGFYSAPLFEWLFASDVGYAIPFTMILLFLDQTVFMGEMRLLVVASLACALASAAALHGGLSARVRHLDPLLIVASAFGCFALFWAWGNFSFYWGVNQGSVMAVMWLLLCIAALASYDASRCNSTAQRPGLLLLAGVMAALATFTHGMGVLSWSAVLVISIVGRLPVRSTAAFAAAAALCIGLSIIGSPFNVSALGSNAIAHARGIVEFAVVFVGAPVGVVVDSLQMLEPDDQYAVSLAAGSIGVLGFAAYLTRALVQPASVDAARLPALGLMIFAVAAGVLVALGRLSLFGPMQAIGERFLGWSVLFWIGAVCALTSIASLRQQPTVSAVVIVVIALASGAMTAKWSATRSRHARDLDQLALTNTLLLLGVRHRANAKAAFARDPDLLFRVAAHLADHQRSPFSRGLSELVGSRWSEHFESALPQQCRGAIESTRRMAHRDREVFVVDGWVRDRGENRELDLVFMADDNERIAGLGFARRATAPIAEPAAKHRWRGVLAASSPPGDFSAYAVFDGRACALGALGE